MRKYQLNKCYKLTQVTSMKLKKKLRVLRKTINKVWKKLQGLN